MRGQRIAIIGDVMLDRYIWGEVQRISPEAPVPVVEASRETYRLGGAANVAANVHALGGEAILIGVLGADREGETVSREIRASGLGADSILVASDRPTTVKTRIIARNQQVVRVDVEVTRPLDAALEETLRGRLSAVLETADALIVSDYGKGVLTESLLRFALPQAARCGVPVSVDPKESHFSLYRGISVITPNVTEAGTAVRRKLRTEEDVLRAGVELRERLQATTVLITRGSQGMTLFEADGWTHFPAVAKEVYDVTGAGDTVVATFGLAHSAGGTAKESAEIANLAASLVVAEVGTTVATIEGIQAAFGAAGSGKK